MQKISHVLLSITENSDEVGNGRVLLDIYVKGYGAEDKTCPGTRTTFRKVVE